MYHDYKCRETYLLPIDDKTLQMISDSRVKAACLRTGCLFFVQNRMCSRVVCGHVLRYCILEVRGVTPMDIYKMNRLMESYYPEYRLRKPHDAKGVKTRLTYNEWTPDNSNLFFTCQRFGLGRGTLADVDLTGPCGGTLKDWQTYHTGLMDMIADVPRSPWMTSRREFDGLYTTSFGHCINYQPVLFRRASKNKTYKGRNDFQLTTEPLPKMNYFTDPGYLEHLIDPMLAQTIKMREAALEAERHSHKTMMPGSGKPDKGKKAEEEKEDQRAR